MADFEIFVDSAANIPDDIRLERGIHVIPYLCTVNGEEMYCLKENSSFRDCAIAFYQKMRENAEIKTSLITEERFIEALSPSLEEGKDVVLITIASGISGTYHQAVNAQKTLAKRFPKRKVFVADSANASLGEGLLAIKVADLRDLGESAAACADWLKHNTYKMNSFLTVEDLNYLRKGGRISRTLALAGSLLNIKPLITADGGVNAKLTMMGKARGRRKALSAIVEEFDKHAIRPETQTIAIAHADCEDEAKELAETLKAHGAGDVILEYYDLCTGSHVGPGTIAVFFMGTDRRGDSPHSEPLPHGKPVRKKI